LIELLIATRNRNKVREIASLMEEASTAGTFHTLEDLDIAESVDENGATFMENARIKALFYSRFSSLLTVAEDSGLEVSALDNRPGVYSARYAGKNAGDDERIGKLLLEMASVRDRRARFVCAAVLARNGAEVASFSAEVRGEILTRKRGGHGFGYDPIFFYPPLQKTFAELTLEEKNRVSHRAATFRELKSFLVAGFRF
jgi:XTP/dITP diphosphohydrolase